MFADPRPPKIGASTSEPEPTSHSQNPSKTSEVTN